MRFNKIIGYILLIGGLIIIGASLFQSYKIFTGKALPPLVFKTIVLEKEEVTSLNASQQIQELIKKQINQALDPATITKILNLISWSLFSLVLIFGGGTICNIGIRMIRS